MCICLDLQNSFVFLFLTFPVSCMLMNFHCVSSSTVFTTFHFSYEIVNDFKSFSMPNLTQGDQNKLRISLNFNLVFTTQNPDTLNRFRHLTKTFTRSHYGLTIESPRPKSLDPK